MRRGRREIASRKPVGSEQLQGAVLWRRRRRSKVDLSPLSSHVFENVAGVALQIDHLNKPEITAVMDKAKFYYIAGFFITVSPDSIMKVATHANESGKTFCMNLSAPFIMEVPPFREALTKAMPYIDYLFGNETEAATFAKVMEWGEQVEKDVPAIAKRQVSRKEQGEIKNIYIKKSIPASLDSLPPSFRDRRLQNKRASQKRQAAIRRHHAGLDADHRGPRRKRLAP